MKALWTGFLCFGLLDIPIKLYSATRERPLRLTMLDKESMSPIGQTWVRKDTGEAVPPDRITRGYEYETGNYIALDESDFKAANARKTEVVEILGFAPKHDIDTKYFQKPYYIAPERGTERIYVLLREALRRSGRVGIARFVFRNREYLAALKVEDRALLLNQLRYAEDIRPVSELDIPLAAEYSNREMDMALSLIEQMQRPFNPSDYRDAYAHELQQVIEEKRRGGTPRIPDAAAKTRPLNDADVLPRLEESLRDKPQ